MDDLARHRIAAKAHEGDSSDTTPLEALELARQYVEANPGVTSLVVVVEPPRDDPKNIHLVFADCTVAQAGYLLDIAKLTVLGL